MHKHHNDYNSLSKQLIKEFLKRLLLHWGNTQVWTRRRMS